MPPKYALYHQAGKPGLKLVVAKDHGDETVDLANEKGVLIVGACPVKPTPEHGCCTLLTDEEAVKAAKQLRQKANELKKQATAATKAAKDAEGKPNHADLVKAAADAVEKAEQADKDADEAEAFAK